MGHRWRIGAWVLCGLSWIACGDSDSSNAATVTGDENVSAKVDVHGARLELASGVNLEVPQDALGQPVKVELKELRSTELPEEPEVKSLEKAVAFRPHGQKFDRDVTIEMPIDTVPAGHKVRLLRLDDEQDTSWEEITDFTLRDASEHEKQAGDNRQRLSFKTRGFSVYWPVSAPQLDASTPVEDGSTSSEDAGVSASDDGGADAGPDSGSLANDGGADANDAGGTTASQDSGASTTDAGAPDAGTDAGAPPTDSGTAADASMDSGAQDAGLDASAQDAGMDASAQDAGDTCQATFDTLTNVKNCTSDLGALGYPCEGFVGANSGMTCQQFCTAWGGTCAEVYPSMYLMCNAYNTDAGTLPCDSLGDNYCACGLF